jgi:hypothetical protein
VEGVGAREMVRRASWRKFRIGSFVGEMSEEAPEEGFGRKVIGVDDAESEERKEERKDVDARREPDSRYLNGFLLVSFKATR